MTCFALPLQTALTIAASRIFLLPLRTKWGEGRGEVLVYLPCSLAARFPSNLAFPIRDYTARPNSTCAISWFSS